MMGFSWVQEALRASHADKPREQEEAIARLRAECDRLQRRLDTMYVDRLDGRVDAASFDKMAAEWRAEQSRCQREIDRHQEADKSHMDEGAQILELARNAQQPFERQEPRQKRRLHNFVLFYWRRERNATNAALYERLKGTSKNSCLARPVRV